MMYRNLSSSLLRPTTKKFLLNMHSPRVVEMLLQQYRVRTTI